MLLSGHEGEVYCCKFHPNGATLASAGFDRLIRTQGGLHTKTATTTPGQLKKPALEVMAEGAEVRGQPQLQGKLIP
ncbi:U5 small nuclear ribonucleoprotein 40 kDa protein [Ophiophagus hannah]|uniref:U5 small nuclear ribonucleoprotein 40 kDa protein n=1 Tax=Ophiophagus hannah TaxID=8665 RepID=V8NSK4_OPHHA|nr:U5 small nuclear ribonucleoprotein 40 kDa protein [Ophiophagus hannah]